jgi:hypothetical protein
MWNTHNGNMLDNNVFLSYDFQFYMQMSSYEPLYVVNFKFT